MFITYDDAKRATNLRVHGLDFVAVEAGFDFAKAMIVPSYADRGGRARFKAIGEFEGRIVVVVSPLGTETISLISFRPASTKERKAYDER